MSKQSLLLVDGDTRSLRVLEVSLRKAGFTVTPAVSVKDALDKLELHAPDLIISETKFPTDLDGFELRRRVRATPDWAEIPFVFLTTETAIENKIRGLELGVEDYLTKPIYIKEIVTRINILLQKRQRAGFDERKDGMRFAGRVADMPVVDVIQTIEVSRKSGVIQFTGTNGRQAAIYFRDGKVIDAEAGTLQGEDAVYRLLTWADGDFEVVFRTVRRREAIQTSSQGLLMEGMRRLDEWTRLLEQLPPLAHRFEIDVGELAGRLGEVPDDNNRILRLIDGKRSLLEVIDASDFGDLECLQAISRLFFEGLLLDLDPDLPARRDTGKPMPLVVVDDHPTPMEEVTEEASGTIDINDLAVRAGDAQPVPLADPEMARDTDRQPAQPEPAPEPASAKQGSITMGWDVPPEPAAEGPVAAIAAAAAAAPPPAEPVSSPAIPITPDQMIEEPEPDHAGFVDQSAFEDGSSPAPLLGQYRQSSLRLIDEAVAAAQLIEPSLFEDVPKTPPKRPSGSTVPPPLPTRRPATMPPPLPPAREDKPHEIGAKKKNEDFTDEEASKANGSGVIELIQDFSAFASSDAEEDGAPKAAADEKDSSGVPTAIEAEEPPEPPPHERHESNEPPVRRFAATISREDSGLKMIGSLGRDRAEASGEVRLPARPGTENGETARELVTILPRRKTGEMPTLDPATLAAATAEAPAAKDADQAKDKDTDKDKAAAEAKPASARASTAPITGKAVEPPPPPPPVRRTPPRVSVAGGVVKKRGGPGPAAAVLLIVASVLAGATAYMYFHKKLKHPVAAVALDAPEYAVAPADAPAFDLMDAQLNAFVSGDARSAKADAQLAAVKADAAVVAVIKPDAAEAASTPIDAGIVAVKPDAAEVVVAKPDAAVVAVAPVDAGEAAPPPATDKKKEAAALFEKAHAALEDGDPDKALEYADQSLALRKTQRTLLEKARALQRLSRIDEAVKAVDEAIEIDSKQASPWEQRALILWSAKRYDDAKAAMNKYLELDPNGKSATSFKHLLEQQ